MSDDVDLSSHFKYNDIQYLVTFARYFEDKGEYEDLKSSLHSIGWRAFTRPLKPSPISGDAVRSNRTRYYTKVVMPRLENYLPHVELVPPLHQFNDHDDDDTIPLCIGDALLESAWHSPEKLSPQITKIISLPPARGNSYSKIYTTIMFHYVNKRFYPHLRKPVQLPILDHTVKPGVITINTLDDNGKRGLRLEKLIKNDLKDHFPKVSIQIDDIVKRALIRMRIETSILTDILDTITHCLDVLWEWVDSDTIQLIPGENFGKFSHTHGGYKT